MSRLTIAITAFTAIIGVNDGLADNMNVDIINLKCINPNTENIKSALSLASLESNSSLNILKPNINADICLKSDLHKIKHNIGSYSIIRQISLISAIKNDIFKILHKASINIEKWQYKSVDPKHVTYYLYTKINPNVYIQLTKNNLNLLDNKKIVLFIHGWKSNKNIYWYRNLKNAFLANYEYDVVEVDWKKPASKLYSISSVNTRDVGKIIAELIVDLIKIHGLKLNDVLLIGHSLGGQITGYVGKNVYKLIKKKLPRIIALDPAGPIFSERPENDRLNPNDAEVVEVIHSNGGTFGFEQSTGTIDFFPNGGNSQPGCNKFSFKNLITDNPVSCNHIRAFEYFHEALLHPSEFEAKKCSDWESYRNGKCENGESVKLGDLTVNSTGTFYLVTNKKKPFAKSQ